jgi:hypothetical protein
LDPINACLGPRFQQSLPGDRGRRALAEEIGDGRKVKVRKHDVERGDPQHIPPAIRLRMVTDFSGRRQIE